MLRLLEYCRRRRAPKLATLLLALAGLRCAPPVTPAPFSSGSGGSGGGAVCGDLRPWVSLTSASPEHVVVAAADGFAAYTATDIGIFDVRGGYAARVSLLARLPRGATVPVVLPGGGRLYDAQKTWFVKAVSSGSTFALLSYCQYSQGYCGSSLFFSDRSSFSIDDLFEGRAPLAVDISTLFRTSSAGFALAADGTSVIAANFFEPSIDGAWVSKLRVKRLDGFNRIVQDESFALSSPDEVIQVSDVRIDDSGQIFILYSTRRAADSSASALAPGSRLVALTPDFQLLGSWQAPSDVTVRALALDRDGQAVLAGSIDSGSGPSAWLERLDSSTLSESWPAPQIGGSGIASAVSIAANGDFLVAGSGKTEQTAWLERHTTDGAPVFHHRSELVTDGSFLVTTESGTGHFRITGVAEQSDGSVLVSSTASSGFDAGTPFTFPAGGTPPATCSDSGGCDCGPRGFDTSN